LRSGRIGAWIGTALLIVGGLGLASAVAVGVNAVSMPSCEPCHVGGEFKRETEARPHAKLTCLRCHVRSDAGARLSYSAYVVFGMMLHWGPDYGRAAAEVTNATCLECHQKVLKGVAEAKQLRMKHSSCAKGRFCTDCHSDTTHGKAVKWLRTATMEMCMGCHAGNKKLSACNTCHLVTPTSNKTAAGARAVTHGPNWKAAHGMGDSKTCVTCHPAAYCVTCHKVPLPHEANFATTHGDVALAQKAACLVCHAESACTLCHGLPMPHPKGFAKEHFKATVPNGIDTCLKCHEVADCDGCHDAHVHPYGSEGGD
jgi:hypothetical protein